METHRSRNVARAALAVIAMASLASVTQAGSFRFTPGAWSSLTGTAASTPSLYETYSVSDGLSSMLTVKAPSSGTNTIGGTWSFTVVWTPSYTGDPAPTNAKVTLWRTGSFSVAGNGSSRISAGATNLISITSANSFMSGIIWNLPDVVVTLPLILQTDGTYKAVGTVVSDTIEVAFDTSTSTLVRGTEGFVAGKVEGI